MSDLSKKRLFLLDMDGTLYLGNSLFPQTLPFLDYIHSVGGKALFLTNNSSKSAVKYVEKLAKLGIASTADDFLTSAQATALYLKQHPPEGNIYVCGTQSFVNELKSVGLPVTDDPDDRVTCVTLGFDTELTFQKLENCSRLLTDPAITYIASHPDLVCPTEWGYVPDCGGVTEMLYYATGRRPLVIGKPQPEMALLAMKKTGFTPEQTVLVGDRLYTDIACGVNAEIDTVLVLSGESTMQTVKESAVKPTYIMENVGELTAQCKKCSDKGTVL